MGKNEPVAIGAVLGAAVILGFNPVATKMLYQLGMAPIDFISSRPLWCLGLYLLVAFAFRPRAIERADAWKFALLGVCYGPGTGGLLPLGLAKTSAAHAVILFALGPPLTAGLGALLLRESLSRLKIFAMVFGIGGAAIVAFGKTNGHPDSLLGDGLVLGMVLATAIQCLVLRRITGSYSPLFMASLYGAIGSLMLLAITIPIEGLRFVAVPLQIGTLGALLFFGEIVVGVSLLAQALQSFALHALKAGLVSAILRYAALAVGVALAVLLLREKVTLSEIAGGILLAVSVALTLIPDERSTAHTGRAHTHPDFHPMHH